MPFQTTTPAPAPALQAPLGSATVTILGPRGLRLSGYSSFHLDEGPDYAWLNVYRILADGKEIDITRDRQPSQAGIDAGAAAVRWPPTDHMKAEVFARYSVVEKENAVDITYGAKLLADYGHFEIFIASYFTPYHRPFFALQDHRTHPEGVVWYEKIWNAEQENESWARDAQAEEVFRDGRWLTGFALNWKRGPHHACPLMIQHHRCAGHAVILMARPQDCFGISGFNSFHNAQYFHLGGRDVKAGEEVSFPVRMLLTKDVENVKQVALDSYKNWLAK
ncbi:MAG: hypothetical protein NTW19_13150 [Planctomycetota bacterium]|nr:hypothetical protein [Planctomycetota bacterium]